MCGFGINLTTAFGGENQATTHHLCPALNIFALPSFRREKASPAPELLRGQAIP